MVLSIDFMKIGEVPLLSVVKFSFSIKSGFKTESIAFSSYCSRTMRDQTTFTHVLQSSTSSSLSEGLKICKCNSRKYPSEKIQHLKN